MTRLRKFLQLPYRDQRLLLRALRLVVTIRARLWLTPFERVRRRVERMATDSNQRAKSDQPADKLIGAVGAAACFVPGASCLTQAMAAHILLRRAGCASIIKIGVLREGSNRLKAHAWIELDGRIVLGQIDNLAKFVPLPPLP